MGLGGWNNEIKVIVDVDVRTELILSWLLNFSCGVGVENEVVAN